MRETVGGSDHNLMRGRYDQINAIEKQQQNQQQVQSINEISSEDISMSIIQTRTTTTNEPKKGILKSTGHIISNHPITVEPYHHYDPTDLNQKSTSDLENNNAVLKNTNNEEENQENNNNNEESSQTISEDLVYLGALYEMNGIEPLQSSDINDIKMSFDKLHEEHKLELEAEMKISEDESKDENNNNNKKEQTTTPKTAKKKTTRLKFSQDPIKVQLTYAYEDYERRGEGIDPLAATAQYELEKRIEKMDTFEVKFSKNNNDPLGIVIIGMGVGADAGMEKLGIFIKIIQEDSPAYKTGQLQIGDMLVEINEINLVGVTQNFATKTLNEVEDEITFLIAREKEGQVSEIQDLIQQSLEMDRMEEERNAAIASPTGTNNQSINENAVQNNNSIIDNNSTMTHKGGVITGGSTTKYSRDLEDFAD